MSRRAGDVEDDPTWYRIRYATAAQRLHTADLPKLSTEHMSVRELVEGFVPELGENVEDQAAAAGQESEELVTVAARRLRAAHWPWPGRRPPWYAPGRWPPRSDRDLVDFLHSTLEPAAVVLLWSARVERGWLPGIIATRAPSAVDRRSPYDEAWLEGYVADLAFGGRRPPSRLVRLLGWLGSTRHRPPTEPHYRVRYNLACLYSRMAVAVNEKAGGRAPQYKALLEESARHLEASLVRVAGEPRKHMAQWAKRDPGLSGLREGLRRRFEDIVGPSSAQAGSKQHGNGGQR